jgi:SAM-dependent methyltransferase
MAELYKTRSSCRLCESADLVRVLQLTPTPPANAFVTEDGLNEDQPVFPLNVFYCNNCAHVQLLDVVDPALLFENYVYVSGTSASFVKHFADYAEDVVNRFGPADGHGRVVDIGSNDGTLLAEFRKLGLNVLGIDPARDIASNATANGIETLACFFSPALAAELASTRGQASIITANNVFAHADDLKGIVEGVRNLLAQDGVFVFEVSYLVDVFEKTLFDTIYHEHLAYHSVKPLERFFADNGMELFAASRVDSHGGSLRGYAQLSGGAHATDGSVESLIEFEKCLGLHQVETFVTFSEKINALGADLKSTLNELKAKGKSIAGFGAPAKATTLMYHFGIDDSVIDFIIDDNPLKQNMYSPGLHIPIVASEVLYQKSPDAVVILAWNFAEPIMNTHARYSDEGGLFIIPLPSVGVF